MSARDLTEILAAGSIPLAIICLFINRWLSGKSLGVRAIQMLAVSMFMPTVIVLALEKIIDGAAVAALIGGVVGYLFANIAEYDRSTERGSS